MTQPDGGRLRTTTNSGVTRRLRRGATLKAMRTTAPHPDESGGALLGLRAAGGNPRRFLVPTERLEQLAHHLHHQCH